MLRQGLQHDGDFRIGQDAGGAEDAAEHGLAAGLRDGRHGGDGLVAGIKPEEPVALRHAAAVGVELHAFAGPVVLGGEFPVVVQNPLQAEFFEVGLVHFDEAGFDFHLVGHDVELLENALEGFEVVRGVGHDQLADAGVVGDGCAGREFHAGLFEEVLDVGLGHRDPVAHGHKVLIAIFRAHALALHDDIDERRLDGVHAGDDVADRRIQRRDHDGAVLDAVFQAGDFGDVLDGIEHADAAQVQRDVAHA